MQLFYTAAEFEQKTEFMNKAIKKWIPFSVLLACCICQLSCSSYKKTISSTVSAIEKEAAELLRKQIIEEAEWAMNQQPLTITTETSPRSAGNKHDFFSESDYFWPNPDNPNGPYKERDGITNPDNFLAHRKLMIRFSKIIGALASAYKLTGDEKYVRQAVIHLKAWFVDPETLMNPSLQFAQAVRQGVTGRNYGIIDTIHFMEVAQGVIAMEHAAVFDKQTAIRYQTMVQPLYQLANYQ
jgi:hypothetical protein